MGDERSGEILEGFGGSVFAVLANDDALVADVIGLGEVHCDLALGSG